MFAAHSSLAAHLSRIAQPALCVKADRGSSEMLAVDWKGCGFCVISDDSQSGLRNGLRKTCGAVSQEDFHEASDVAVGLYAGSAGSAAVGPWLG
jgi:hypothetical protein